ncbi:MAG: YgjV family protein [Turicibacter sp.]|nr:YgjV family protein [Turicibacter sp.]
MTAIIQFFQDSFREILEIHVHNPMWMASQVFAFFSLITMFWSFQIRNKLKMMLLLGLGTTFLAVSAALLDNWTLTVLFGIASIRNYVFCYFEWRQLKDRPVPRSIWKLFGGIFIIVTVASTLILVHIMQVRIHSVWLEWLICGTLIGLIIGNVLEGDTHCMRISFIFNRIFNIINHAYFFNVIAVIIACLTISSNLIFYLRQLMEWHHAKKHNQTYVWPK